MTLNIAFSSMERVDVVADIAQKADSSRKVGQPQLQELSLTVSVKDPSAAIPIVIINNPGCMPKQCDICVENRQSSEMMKISDACSHTFCKICVSMHIKTKVVDNQVDVPCLGQGCRQKVEYKSCIGFISQDVLEAWDNAFCESMIPDTFKFYCPFKDCSAMLVNDLEKGIQQCECPHCHRLFCAQCRVPWHVSVSCSEFQLLNEDERGNADLMVKMLADENKWGRCPTCKYYVERTVGCPHMVCRCKFEFCYGCEKQWTDSHGGCARS